MHRRAITIFLLVLLSAGVTTASAQIGTLTECPVGTMFGSSQPEQVHIQYPDDPTQMVVVWATSGQTGSEVEYGAGESMDESAQGTEACYDHGMVFHTATMTGLETSTEYTYRVGDGSDWSQTFEFTTPAASSTSFEFVAFGDHGMSDEAEQTYDLIEGFSETELVILAGDISYANGDQSVWDDYANQYQSSMASIPWMVTPGNHENESGYGFDAYETRFEMPSSSDTDLWHSFDYQGVHFIALSTEHDYTAGSAQLDWFKADLAAADANRDNVPWIVVYGHKPAYTTHGGGGHDDQMLEIRDIFEPLLVEHQVDLIIWGHDHFYERTWPVINATVKQRGVADEGFMFSGDHAPIHIVAGTAGRGSYDPEDDEADWTFHREVSHGLLHITVDSTARSMHVEYVRLDGTIGDSFLLLQEKIPIVEEEKGLPGVGTSLIAIAIISAAIIRKPREPEADDE